MPEPRRVRAMFARIAGRYDLLNHLLSAGIDRRWRARAVARCGDVCGRRVLDVCCGTGDLTLAFQRQGARAIGVDFTPEMLTHARRKVPPGGVRPDQQGSLFVQGDALALPAGDASVDLCSVAFGIRNVADRALGLREMRRVLAPGGIALVLEFTTPPGPVLGHLYRSYFTRLLPLVGRFVSGDRDAYEYLPRTVLAWPTPVELQAEMEREGFVECGHELLTRGIACLHWGRRAAEREPGA